MNLEGRIGQEIGVSDWIAVDQGAIDRFADATDDHQPIHVDPEVAGRSQFGGTIAHGMLTLSLLPAMFSDVVGKIEEGETGINYGFDHVRFLAPVRSGARVRGRFVLEDLQEPRPGTRKMHWRVTVEVEGQDRPALAARWINMVVAGQ